MSNRRLNDSDLEQLTPEYLWTLSVKALIQLIIGLLHDLRQALDQLNQNSNNSSCPSSHEPPWFQASADGENNKEEDQSNQPKNNQDKSEQGGDEPESCDENISEESEDSSNLEETSKKGKPGRQEGMKGYGRKLELPISSEEFHHPETCHGCGKSLDQSLAIAWTALYVLDLDTSSEVLFGLQLTHIKHFYTQIECTCGHITQAEPGRCHQKGEFTVALSEWHLVGPVLATFIVCLNQRLRASRRLTQEFLLDWLGVYLSTSTINQCIHEAGRALAPIEDQLVEEVNQADLIHGDETSWKEAGKLLWLWVFSSRTVTLYLIGHRTKEIIQNLLGSEFAGWLMSDGYSVYRDYLNRLRCWAHVVRKAKGLCESHDHEHARVFGTFALDLLNELMDAVYQARGGDPPLINLLLQYSERLDQFKLMCEEYRDCPHMKTRQLAREFLNDWDAFWIVLRFPQLPLTNNEAERALRHWVIARLISQGTRTEEGTRVFGILASVIETCRKRGITPWPYIAEVIAQRRKGNPAPPLPVSAEK